jgi:hypothetical protein
LQAVIDGYREKLSAARKEESAARAAFVEKKNGLDSAWSVIGKLNQANSIEVIDELVRILRGCIDFISLLVLCSGFQSGILSTNYLDDLDCEEREDYGT